MRKKDNPKWWERLICCKVWLANYNMNLNESQKYFALQWGLKTKYVDKPHYCSFTDRDHKVTQDYEKRRKSGKEIVYKFVTPKDMFADLDGKPTEKKFVGRNKYGNKIYDVKRVE